MTDENLDYDDADDDGLDGYEENSNLKQLRSKAKQHDKVAAELADLKREMAFTKVGVPDDTPAGKLLRKAYTGEPTPEAIRAFAVEHGAIEASEVPAGELDAADRVAALRTGAGVPKPAVDMNQEIRKSLGRA